MKSIFINFISFEKARTNKDLHKKMFGGK